jgi:hypothetical protein
MLKNLLRTIEITLVVHGSRAAIKKAKAPLLPLSDFIVVQYERNDKVQPKSPNAEITPKRRRCRQTQLSQIGNSRAPLFQYKAK